MDHCGVHMISAYALSDCFDFFNGVGVNPEAGHVLTPLEKAKSHCGALCIWLRSVSSGLVVFLLSPSDSVSKFCRTPSSFRKSGGPLHQCMSTKACIARGCVSELFLFTLTGDLQGAGWFKGFRAKRSGDRLNFSWYVIAYFVFQT